MNTSLLWMGIVPVLAFVILDTLTGKKAALWGALILGAGELIPWRCKNLSCPSERADLP